MQPRADIVPHPMIRKIHGTNSIGSILGKNYVIWKLDINDIPDINTQILEPFIRVSKPKWKNIFSYRM